SETTNVALLSTARINCIVKSRRSSRSGAIAVGVSDITILRPRWGLAPSRQQRAFHVEKRVFAPDSSRAARSTYRWRKCLTWPESRPARVCLTRPEPADSVQPAHALAAGLR